MEREIDLKEISDGRFYDLNDMVKAGCDDCRGCSACCRGMGESILLDPLDIFRLTDCRKCSFEQLLDSCIELHVVDGVILPNLKMAGEEEACTFLNGEGRCSIHPFRPGICRLFPLGRCYEEGTFRYFLQVHECPKENKTKVKVKKWIDTPELKRNQEFITAWHYFLKDVQKLTEGCAQDALQKKICMYVLNQFYVQPYDRTGDFYEQFDLRLREAKRYLGIAG